MDRCLRVGQVVRRNLVDRAYRLGREDLVVPFVPVGRQWLGLGLLVPRPSRLLRLDLVVLVDQVVQVHLGFHLNQEVRLDLMVHQVRVVLEVRVVLVRMLPLRGIKVSSNP